MPRSNEAHKAWARRRLREVLGDLRGRSVAVLGLSYKPGTDSLRRSVAVETCRWLREQGAAVTACDPVVRALPPELAAIIDLRPTAEAALRGASAALLATEWPEFASLRADDVVQWMRETIVLDPGSFLAAALGADARIRYFAVGRRA